MDLYQSGYAKQTTPLPLDALAVAPPTDGARVQYYGFSVAGVIHPYVVLSDGTAIDLTPTGVAPAPSDAPFFTNGAVTGLSAEVDITASGTALSWARVISFGANAGYVRWTSGVVVTATEYAIQRDADATNQLHFNVPTGATFEWSVNDVARMVVGAAFDVNATETVTIDSSGGAISIGADADAQAMSWGTGGAARTLTYGNAIGATGHTFNAGTGAYTYTMTDANTGAAGSQTTQMTFAHASTATPVAGFGTLLVLRGHNADNTMVDQAYISSAWSVAGAGSEVASLGFGIRSGGVFVLAAQLIEPSAGNTALVIRRNVAGVLDSQTVSMGAADSAGVGFKLLKVPN